MTKRKEFEKIVKWYFDPISFSSSFWSLFWLFFALLMLSVIWEGFARIIDRNPNELWIFVLPGIFIFIRLVTWLFAIKRKVTWLEIK